MRKHCAPLNSKERARFQAKLELGFKPDLAERVDGQGRELLQHYPDLFVRRNLENARDEFPLDALIQSFKA